MQLQYGVLGPISSLESDIEQIYEQYLILTLLFCVDTVDLCVFFRACGIEVAPTVYTDVDYHMGWIKNVIMRNGGA